MLRKSIDKRVTLVAYNKQEIKQLGQQLGDHCNPIIGLHDSIALNLLGINVPFTDRWTDKSCSFRADSTDVEEVGEEKLTHDFI